MQPCLEEFKIEADNPNGDVTSHVSPSQVPENPIDIKIPVATPKPLGKRISWRELVNQ